MTRVKVFDRNQGKPGRAPNYWIRYTVAGKEVREPAKDTKRSSAEFAAHIGRMVDAGEWVHPRDRKAGRHLFQVYALEVIDRRVKRGVATADKDERGHVIHHLTPMFGGMRLADIGFQLIRSRFAELRAEGKLAGRTIRNVHNTLRAILQEAIEDGAIAVLPPALSSRRGHLPPIADRDPNWRRTAVFTRVEVSALLSCEDVPINRRALYATLFLTGARVGELLGARFQDLDMSAEPLGSLSYVAEKTGRHKGQMVRIVPIHPELRTWLDWWTREGFEIVHCKAPGPSDLLFPTASERRIRQGEVATSYSELYMQWMRNDLPAAGLRHRRIHDTRRTFVSTCRSSARDVAMVRSITHTAVADTVMAAYTEYEWEAICRAIEAVRWGIPGPTLEPRTHVSVDLPAMRIRREK